MKTSILCSVEIERLIFKNINSLYLFESCLLANWTAIELWLTVIWKHCKELHVARGVLIKYTHAHAFSFGILVFLVVLYVNCVYITKNNIKLYVSWWVHTNIFASTSTVYILNAHGAFLFFFILSCTFVIQFMHCTDSLLCIPTIV